MKEVEMISQAVLHNCHCKEEFEKHLEQTLQFIQHVTELLST